MPLYEFRCESCGHETEMIMLFSDPLPTICETCGGPLKKLLSAPAVQFKGSGFYLTDYGRSGNAGTKDREAASAAGETKTQSDGKASGEGKSSGDGKPSAETKSPSESKPTGETKSGASGGAPAGSGGDAKTPG